jgi:hypothetical protein
LNLLVSITQVQIYAGRPVRRVVSFFDSVRDLVEENDRRVLLEIEPSEKGEQHSLEYVHVQ